MPVSIVIIYAVIVAGRNCNCHKKKADTNDFSHFVKVKDFTEQANTGPEVSCKTKDAENTRLLLYIYP